MEQDCTRFAVLILCHDSIDCDEMGDCIDIETNTMIDIVCEGYLNKNWF